MYTHGGDMNRSLVSILFCLCALLGFTSRASADLMTHDFNFEGGLPPGATTNGNVNVVTSIPTRTGSRASCYEGNQCLHIAPGQGQRNHDAFITFKIDVHTGDIISFAYIIIPQSNNDFVGLTFTGGGFSDTIPLPPSDIWTMYTYVVPDMSVGPGIMSATAPSDSSLTFLVENVVGDTQRTALGLDALQIMRVPEPQTAFLALLSLCGLRLHKKPR